jgi:hypothetical protein
MISYRGVYGMDNSMKKSVMWFATGAAVLAALVCTACPAPNEPSDGAKTNKTALGNAIADAQTLADQVLVLDESENLTNGAKYAAEEDIQIFLNAIEAAKTVFNRSSATQKAVDDAKNTLMEAQMTFESRIILWGGGGGGPNT